MRRTMSFTLNGKPVRLETDDKRSLLWALRTDLGLTGTKYGCGAGLCGSCTVVVDGKAVRSCQATLGEVQDKKVTTIEGLAARRQAPPAPAGLRRSRRLPVRLLHARDDHERLRPAPRRPPPLAREGHRRDGGQPLPLQRLQEDPGSHRVRVASRREAGHERRARPPLVPEARRRGHRRPRPPRPGTLLAQGRGYPTDINAYLRIGEDGRVTVFSGKIEMGQGVMTSLAQMAAEDLGVALDSIEMVMGDTDRCPWDMGTFGSLTTRMFGPALRAAAAEARQVLVQLASEKLGVPKDRLVVEKGVVSVKGEPARKVSYGAARAGPGDHADGGREGGAAGGPGVHGHGPLAPAARRAWTRSRAPASTPATSACRACCTRGSCARPPTGRRSAGSTRPRPRRWTA